MNKQVATIDQLTNAPTQRKEAVRVINPEWQLANQGCTAQKQLCSSIEDQLAILQAEIHRAKGGNRGATFGAAIAMAFVIYFMATRYDARKSSPLNAAFAVRSLSFLIGAAVLGYWFGKWIHIRILDHIEEDTTEWSPIEQKRHELEQRVGTEQKELQRLQQQLTKINQYDSETITTVQETRVLLQ